MEKFYDVVIIGGGPAGLTAGLYASRGALKSLLIEGNASVSQITLTDIVENYPGFPDGIGGWELVEKFRKQALKFGLEMMTTNVKGIIKIEEKTAPLWQVSIEEGALISQALIIATGASWRKLNVPGEDTLIGRGVSYCATCDAPFYRNLEVAVVGGGDTAVQEAIFLTQFARRVHLIHRRNRLRAAGVLQQRLFQNDRINIIWETVVEEIKGKEGGVEELVIKHLPTGEVNNLKVDGVFIFVGLRPNTDLVKGIVDLTQEGAIIVDQEMRTSQVGIFACGDCTAKKLRQVVTACGDGALAAYSAQLFIEDLKGERYPR
ncbi:MAG: thioredoxin-disulfide reductase [Syntrophales bacterium]|nr:thioredoxin-disulfide reductase [Syntrophales bacterium]